MRHKIISMLVFMLFHFAIHAQENGSVEGTVLDKDANPIIGASIKLINSNQSTITDENGYFRIAVGTKHVNLLVSYLGYSSQELTIMLPLKSKVEIILEQNDQELQEVVINTGYQSVPKERATGSFVQIDNELLNRRVSTDILSRLEDVASGLIFDRDEVSAVSNPPIIIRGESTIKANMAPLIVVDNFPYEGDFSTINPNDVESITVLKDAAAASIWGARSGNGVIVITTKKGKLNAKTKVTFNSNFTIGNKPDQFYQSKMTTAEFIEVEKKLFNEGFYKAAETASNKPPLSPVVEMLIEGGKENEIEALKKYDIRNDYNQFLHRKSLNQQYNVNISGGGENQLFYFSAGYDANEDNVIGNDFNRLSLNAKNTFLFIDKKLELNTEVYYSENKRNTNGLSSIRIFSSKGKYTPLYPYGRLVDEEGNNLSVTNEHRLSLYDQAQADGLLHWDYVPLDEIEIGDNSNKLTDYRINTSLRYKVFNGLHANVLYQYARSFNNGRNFQSIDSYYTRNEINRLTIVNADGSLEYPVPLGGIMDYSNGFMNTHNLRAQINLNKEWNGVHRLDAVGGTEIRDQSNEISNYRLYGYDEEHALSKPVDYVNTYKSYFDQYSSMNRISNPDGEKILSDRFLSYYSNAAYSYLNRYTLSGSLRFDQSNLFGVNTNQKGVPLFSLGASWVLSDEFFYKLNFLPYLKLRGTYGYNGNIDKTTSAFVTAMYRANDQNSALTYADIINPPNPELRWERIKVVNAGIDFSTKGNRFSGSVEYYKKDGLDLIGITPYAPSTGVNSFTGNYADTKGRGLDIIWNSKVLTGKLKWDNVLFYSSSNPIVTNYKHVPPVSSFRGDGQFSPMEGKPLYGIYNFISAGLDAETGDPQGYLNGEISMDYKEIIKVTQPEDLRYIGSSRPTKFGAFRNIFSYAQLSLSFNISYRFGYYFRKQPLNYTEIQNGEWGHGDFGDRWIQPGDEQYTQIPSMPIKLDNNRHLFYYYSDVHAEKGDHVRLQDINLSYDFLKSTFPRFTFSRLQVYAYANNLGVLWKASKADVDPDYARSFSPPVRTFAVGLKIDF